MRKIELSKNKVAIIDDEDYELISQYNWYYSGNGYAMGWVSKKRIYLHRFLLNAPKGSEVDHVNGDKLDCRRKNIRICTTSQNQANRKAQKNNTTGYKGVSWNKRENRYIASIKINGVKKLLGYFSTPEDAAHAYDKEAQKLFGEYAKLNF